MRPGHTWTGIYSPIPMLLFSHCRALWQCCLWLLLPAMTAQAGSLSARPVRLTLQPGITITSLTLDNTGEDEVLIQSQAMSWKQSNGQDVLEEAPELIVSPPAFKLAAGASQVIRVGRIKAHDGPQEISYRIFLQEVPTPKVGQGSVMQMALRLSLPLFVLPRGKAMPELRWAAARAPSGELLLTLENRGNAHVQCIQYKLLGEADVTISEGPLPGYVLPGNSRTWTLKSDVTPLPSTLKFIAHTDAGEVSVPLTLE